MKAAEATRSLMYVYSWGRQANTQAVRIEAKGAMMMEIDRFTMIDESIENLVPALAAMTTEEAEALVNGPDMQHGEMWRTVKGILLCRAAILREQNQAAS